MMSPGATYMTALVLFSLFGLSQERMLLETNEGYSWNDQLLPSYTDGNGELLGNQLHPVIPVPPALLEGLQVEGGQMVPEFDSNIFSYKVSLSAGITNIFIIAQAALGQDDHKYKVKTKSSVLEPDHSHVKYSSSKTKSTILVEVHVSADDHESVTYYLEVEQVLPLQQSDSNFWIIVRDILWTVGCVIAVTVVGVFVYGIYLSVSNGTVTGGGIEDHHLAREDGSRDNYRSIPAAEAEASRS